MLGSSLVYSKSCFLYNEIKAKKDIAVSLLYF